MKIRMKWLRNARLHSALLVIALQLVACSSDNVGMGPDDAGAGFWAAISAAGGHTCAVTTVGSMYCWGSTDGGSLGDGTGSDNLTPNPVNGTLTWARVSAGIAPVRVSVVVPARNEAQGLAAVLEGVRRALGDVPHEILVVDDGSTDGTGDVAARAGARVLRHPLPMGNGAAVKAGIRAARGEWIALLDGG